MRGSSPVGAERGCSPSRSSSAWRCVNIGSRLLALATQVEDLDACTHRQGAAHLSYRDPCSELTDRHNRVSGDSRDGLSELYLVHLLEEVEEIAVMPCRAGAEGPDLQPEAFDLECGLALLPRCEHATGVEGLGLAYVGLLARRERLAWDDRTAPIAAALAVNRG